MTMGEARAPKPHWTQDRNLGCLCACIVLVLIGGTVVATCTSALRGEGIFRPTPATSDSSVRYPPGPRGRAMGQMQLLQPSVSAWRRAHPSDEWPCSPASASGSCSPASHRTTESTTHPTPIEPPRASGHGRLDGGVAMAGHSPVTLIRRTATWPLVWLVTLTGYVPFPSARGRPRRSA
jgi:hypothetical protein